MSCSLLSSGIWRRTVSSVFLHLAPCDVGPCHVTSRHRLGPRCQAVAGLGAMDDPLRDKLRIQQPPGTHQTDKDRQLCHAVPGFQWSMKCGVYVLYVLQLFLQLLILALRTFKTIQEPSNRPFKPTSKTNQVLIEAALPSTTSTGSFTSHIIVILTRPPSGPTEASSRGTIPVFFVFIRCLVCFFRKTWSQPERKGWNSSVLATACIKSISKLAPYWKNQTLFLLGTGFPGTCPMVVLSAQLARHAIVIVPNHPKPSDWCRARRLQRRVPVPERRPLEHPSNPKHVCFANYVPNASLRILL